jgi:hypothetical protein
MEAATTHGEAVVLEVDSSGESIYVKLGYKEGGSGWWPLESIGQAIDLRETGGAPLPIELSESDQLLVAEERVLEPILGTEEKVPERLQQLTPVERLALIGLSVDELKKLLGL